LLLDFFRSARGTKVFSARKVQKVFCNLLRLEKFLYQQKKVLARLLDKGTTCGKVRELVVVVGKPKAYRGCHTFR
jgi:hypothetical protein